MHRIKSVLVIFCSYSAINVTYLNGLRCLKLISCLFSIWDSDILLSVLWRNTTHKRKLFVRDWITRWGKLHGAKICSLEVGDPESQGFNSLSLEMGETHVPFHPEALQAQEAQEEEVTSVQVKGKENLRILPEVARKRRSLLFTQPVMSFQLGIQPYGRREGRRWDLLHPPASLLVSCTSIPKRAVQCLGIPRPMVPSRSGRVSRQQLCPVQVKA